MRITENIALVASGRLGFGLTSPFDCNVYLVSSRDDAVLIDSGCGLASAEIVTRIERLGIDPLRVSRIFITHSHADHAAGAAGLQQFLNGRIFSPAASVDAMRSADVHASGFLKARAAGIYPAELEYPSIPVFAPVSGGDVFSVGDLTLEAIAAPGHAYDHTVYLLRGAPSIGSVLFAGDLILTDGRVLLQVMEDCRIDRYAATVRRLTEFGIGGLMPGHGGFLLSGGDEVLFRANEQFDRLVPPPSLR